MKGTWNTHTPSPHAPLHVLYNMIADKVYGERINQLQITFAEEMFEFKSDDISVHLHGLKTIADSIWKCTDISSLNSRVSLSATSFASAALKPQPQPREEEPRLRDVWESLP